LVVDWLSPQLMVALLNDAPPDVETPTVAVAMRFDWLRLRPVQTNVGAGVVVVLQFPVVLVFTVFPFPFTTMIVEHVPLTWMMVQSWVVLSQLPPLA